MVRSASVFVHDRVAEGRLQDLVRGQAVLVHDSVAESLLQDLVRRNTVLIYDDITKYGLLHGFLLSCLLFGLLVLLLLLELWLLVANLLVDDALYDGHDFVLVLVPEVLAELFHAVEVRWLGAIEAELADGVGAGVALGIVLDVFELVHEVVVS